MTAAHFNDLKYLNHIDWNCIQYGNFSKSDGDFDRQRRYQAEFLVHNFVPANCIESINVYNEKMKTRVAEQVNQAELEIPVHIHTPYFFD